MERTNKKKLTALNTVILIKKTETFLPLPFSTLLDADP